MSAACFAKSRSQLKPASTGRRRAIAGRTRDAGPSEDALPLRTASVPDSKGDRQTGPRIHGDNLDPPPTLIFSSKPFFSQTRTQRNSSSSSHPKSK